MTAASATIGLPSTERSAISSTDMTAMIRIEPWMNRPTPSTASASPTVVSEVECSANTAASAPSSPAIVRPTCTPNRSARGTNASTSTPTHATPSTIRMGHNAW